MIFKYSLQFTMEQISDICLRRKNSIKNSRKIAKISSAKVTLFYHHGERSCIEFFLFHLLMEAFNGVRLSWNCVLERYYIFALDGRGKYEMIRIRKVQQ